MTELQLTSDDGRRYLTDIHRLFDEGVNVSPTLAGRRSVEIGAGLFDKLRGRMLMAARGESRPRRGCNRRDHCGGF
jgi:hypothetical protein